MKRNRKPVIPLRLSDIPTIPGVVALAALFALGCFPDKLTATSCTPGTLTQASANADTVTTTTGLRYIEGSVGGGNRTGWCRGVQIDYDAYVLGGGKFDSSRDAGIPLVFVPGTGIVIEGLEQGVIAMNVGGTRRLIIPPALGFGSDPRRDNAGNIIVPGNSTLIYDIEILEVGQ